MRWLREPLIHFAVAGAILFWLFDRRAAAGDAELVVTAERIEQLGAGFAGTWRRPPTDAELARLIDDWVREEVLYREALRLGLDRDDAIVRRQLARKVEFITEDLAEVTEPTDDQLRDFLAAHSERFRVDARLSLEQVFVDPAKHGDQLGAVVARVLAELRQAEGPIEPAAFGDPSLLPSRLDRVNSVRLRNTFGDGFVDGLEDASVGEWDGPIASGYGEHVVRITARSEARVPELSEVREAVERDWAAERRNEAKERFVDALRAGYRVKIELPVPEAR